MTDSHALAHTDDVALLVPSQLPTVTLYGTILVVDDDPDVCEFLNLALENLGMTPCCASNATELCDMVDRLRPAAILLDLALGQTDAIVMLTLLQERQYKGPVVLMSGNYLSALHHSKRIGVRLGIDVAGVLAKPFGLPELRESLGAALMTSRRSAFQQQAPALTISLEDAIRDGQVEFWFQPKIDLVNMERAGIEILSRVRRPDFGVLNPASFLDGASPASLRWLATAGLRESMRATRELSPRGRSTSIAINIAHSTLDCDGFLEELKSIRDDIDPQADITLEITETDLGEGDAPDRFCTRAVLHGFKISVDDFGHGYATFERLRTMAFSELKIERSLVHGCAQDTAMQKICSASVRLAHDFRANAVAEGVERAEDLEMVRLLGFDHVQGYHFAKPAPLSAL